MDDADWIGRWVNEYDSVVVITGVEDGAVRGTFRTALEDSAFHGRDLPLSGSCAGRAIAFTAADDGRAISYTGALVDGQLETLWTFVDGDAPWWRAALTNRDTFQRRD